MSWRVPVLVALAACRGPDPAPRTPSTGDSTPSGGTPPTDALPRWDGTLAEARDRILVDLYAGRDTEAYVPADVAALVSLREVAVRLASGRTDVAEYADRAGYQAVLVEDEANDRDVVVVWEPEPALHQGALWVALDDAARPVVVESPHAMYDGNTGPQGAELFVALRARAWMVNTAHRCADAASSPCAGTTTACGEGTEPYRVSDVAHAVDGAFQAWHEGLLAADPVLVAVQNHGFAHTDGEPEAYVSDGTPWPADAGALSNRLADALDAVLPVGAASCNLAADAAVARFCATANTQGRYANGALEPCLDEPWLSTGRFLHVEQSWELRNHEGPVRTELLRDALDAVLPR